MGSSIRPSGFREITATTIGYIRQYFLWNIKGDIDRGYHVASIAVFSNTVRPHKTVGKTAGTVTYSSLHAIEPV
jgi:hypothetical protein